MREPMQKSPSPRKGKKILPVGHYRGLGGWTIFFFIFLYLPIVVLIFYSFNANRMVMNWGGFGFDWYLKAFENEDIQKAVWNSLIVATVAVLIFFSAIGMNWGLGNVIIAHITFCIPFAFMPIRARLEGMDTSLEQAARDLYASQWETFRYVTVPLLMPGIVAGAMLAFVISMDDFIITLMVGGAGSTTLPVYIYSMIRRGLTPEINAVSTVLLLVSIGIVTAYWIVSKKSQSDTVH